MVRVSLSSVGRSARKLAVLVSMSLLAGLIPILPAAADPSVDLWVSWESDRSSEDLLDGQFLDGDVFVFSTTSESVVDQVSFWIDDPTMSGPADRVDTAAPFDLIGGDEFEAAPLDTTGLAAGEHTVTVKFEYPVLADQTVNATFTVDNVELDLKYSTDADRTPPLSLNGADLSGEVFIFAMADDPAVEQVSFWIDDEEMSGDPDRVDTEAPFDLVGGDEVEADPFDTSLLLDGEHSVTVLAEIDGLDPSGGIRLISQLSGVLR
jgi:hypothetical protein